MEILNSEALSTYMTPKKESINQMWQVFSISFQWQFLMFHFFRDVFVHQYKFTNSNEVRKFHFWNSGILPRNEKKRNAQMAVCRSPSPLNPVDVKLRVSRQFVFGIGVFLKDGGLTMHISERKLIGKPRSRWCFFSWEESSPILSVI